MIGCVDKCESAACNTWIHTKHKMPGKSELPNFAVDGDLHRAPLSNKNSREQYHRVRTWVGRVGRAVILLGKRKRFIRAFIGFRMMLSLGLHSVLKLNKGRAFRMNYQVEITRRATSTDPSRASFRKSRSCLAECHWTLRLTLQGCAAIAPIRQCFLACSKERIRRQRSCR